MNRPEDPTRCRASEARDDWAELCPPPTEDERRENARRIQALSVPDRFALMFGKRPPTETDEAGDPA
jgi:hypothetical protein